LNTKELFYFAGQCLTLDDFPEFSEKITVGFSTGQISINEFIRLCDKNLILPLIYTKFKSHNLLDLFPLDVVELLENVYSLNKTRNNAILNQIKEINITLAKENIIPVYLKGTAHLLNNLYTDVGDRMIGDIDFLVKKDDFFTTAKLLTQLGYTEQYELYPHMADYIHYPPLYRDDSPAPVEIHRIPVDNRYTKNYTTTQVFSQKVKIVKKENCYVPSVSHMVNHNFIHSQLSNSGHLLKDNSLRDLYDLYLLSKRVKPVLIFKESKHKNKALAYLALVEKVFDVNGMFTINPNRNQQLHGLIFDFLLKHQNIHRFYIGCIKYSRLLFISYPGKIIKAASNKSYRKHILNKYIFN
jgi:hypothetical protein